CGLVLAAALGATSPARAAQLAVPAVYPTIQAAVDAAAAGDEVVVAAGLYEEQVVITRSLTLTGAGADLTVIRAPVFMPYTVSPVIYNAVVFAVGPGIDVTLQDLAVDGAGRARTGTRLVGIMYQRAGGLVRRVDIRSVHATPVGTTPSGIGLNVASEPSDAIAFAAEDITVVKFQKSGFAAFGSGGSHDLRRITCDGGLLPSDAVLNAFELANGTTGTITDCTARGAWYDGQASGSTTACGFLFYYAGAWEASGLVAEGNQANVYAIATRLDLRDGTISGYPDDLPFNSGLVVTGPGSAAKLVAGAPARPSPQAETPDKTIVSPLATTVTVTGCTIAGAGLANSRGVVHFASLAETVLDVADCRITDWGTGLLALEAGTARSVGRVRGTWFGANSAAGIYADTGDPCDARGNHWGDPSGPLAPLRNPGGLGDAVVGNVLFDPWLTGNLYPAPLPRYISLADSLAGEFTDEVTIRHVGGGAGVYGYSVEVTWDESVLKVAPGDVTRPAAGPFAEAALFQVLSIPGGVRVDAALGGPAPGAASADLFTVRFRLVGAPDYTEVPLDVHLRHLRDAANMDIAGAVAAPGLVVADVVAPVIGAPAPQNLSLPHTDLYAKNGDLVEFAAPVSDGDPHLGRTDVFADQTALLGLTGYLRQPDSFDGGIARWNGLPVSLYPADGPVLWSVLAVDPAGNLAVRQDTLLADNTPPLPVTGFVATPGPDRVELGWDDPAGLDANLREVVVRSIPTGEYPLYRERWPDFPAAPGAGDSVAAGLAGATAAWPADGSARDVHAFTAFAVDMVGLTSPAAPTAQARTRNYFLADVTTSPAPGYDHLTDASDLAHLDLSWGKVLSDPGFLAECDVGPTDTGTPHGLPLPDGLIDLEDLMIFAERYGAGVGPGPETVPGAGTVRLGWSQPAADAWTLTLLDPCPALKGLRVRVELPAGVTATAAAGSLLVAQADPVHLRQAGDGLDATFAVLGAGRGLAGDGELLRIALDAGLPPPVATYDARGTDNSPLPVEGFVSAVPAEDATPRRFALHGAHPNPANPATRIVFDLPARRRVRLEVFGVDGRRLATLVDGPLPAGRHAVNWDGRDDTGRGVASGAYLFRVRAGTWSGTGKLLLVR
ncbi:hypothetical protein KDM41_17585, partial [bacterium]|nr:hypothetical protein [bacterium]